MIRLAFVLLGLVVVTTSPARSLVPAFPYAAPYEELRVKK